jgi:2-C-methyl-D-erythritol 4-phosphate cytidylyltransferase
MTTNARPFAVLLPAAGSGSRFASGGGSGDKLLIDIAGQSVLQRSVSLFAKRTDVELVMIVTAIDRFDAYEEHLLTANTIEQERLHFVEGGRERWESVLFGLRALAARKGGHPYVAIHDAARPLTPAEVIEEAFRTTVERGAALPCVAEPATLKRRGEDGCVKETVDRRGLFQAQTPQCFELGKLLSAYEKLLFSNQMADLTDDAQVYERMGWPVPITNGASINVKITTAGDVAFARAAATGTD